MILEIAYLGEYSMFAGKECVSGCSSVEECSITYVSVKSSWLVFRSSVFFFIFCLLVLSITKSRVLKSPSIILHLSISRSSSISLCLVYFETLEKKNSML